MITDECDGIRTINEVAGEDGWGNWKSMIIKIPNGC